MSEELIRWPVPISEEHFKGSVACREDTQHGATKRMGIKSLRKCCKLWPHLRREISIYLVRFYKKTHNSQYDYSFLPSILLSGMAKYDPLILFYRPHMRFIIPLNGIVKSRFFI